MVSRVQDPPLAVTKTGFGNRAVVSWGVLALLLPVLLFQGPARAQDDRAVSLMEEAGVRYEAIEVFCAGFQQIMEVPLLEEIYESSGTLCQGQPDRFAMRWTDPEGDRVVADGEFFWVYYPSVDPEQVLQFSMALRPGGLDFHREFLEAPGEKYELEYVGEEVLEGRTAHVISAKPLLRSAFTEARLWLDVERSVILRVRIGMENGSVRTVTLSDIQLDPPTDPDRFRFSVPQGAQVIRRD